MRPPDSSSRWKDVLVWAAVLPVLLVPVANPDLFWHLKAAEQLLALGAVPRADFLSFTRFGEAWVDFEWLVQLLYYGVHRWTGFAGLLALKAALLAMAGALIWALADLHRVSGGTRRAMLLFWAALSLGRSELKPELFSVILFTVELWILEGHRLGHIAMSRPGAWAAASFAFFALWANLHAGFPAGWALLAAYLLGAQRKGLAPLAFALAAGVAGTLINPYGWGIHGVFLEHARWVGVFSQYILEWKPPLLTNPYHWPQCLLLAAVPAALGARAWFAGRPPAAYLASAAMFGIPALLHSRQTAFLIPVGLLILVESAGKLREVLPGRRALRRSLAALWTAACLAYVGWLALPEFREPRAFDEATFPTAACDFVDREMEVFRRRRLYNEWGWGGYLAHRFAPELRVFMDGRYIFHPLLAEVAAANASPRGWQALLDRHGIEWALMANRPQPLRLVAPGPEGRPRAVELPHLRLYMPDSRWVLVHRDPVALLYVRRGAFPREWTHRHELRWLR
ncbi:MAG: hypothetical protein ABII00_14845 [Elusimicrobiota bacterium]